MVETWKEIPGYEGYYSVSDKGRVKSLKRVVPHKLKGKKTIPCKILKATRQENGYQMVGLYKNNKDKSCRVHSLVMLAFVGERKADEEVMHLKNAKQGGTSCLSNLRYGSSKMNSAFNNDDGTHNIGINHPMAKLSESSVIKIKQLLSAGELTHKEIGNIFIVSRQTVSTINQGRSWRHLL